MTYPKNIFDNEVLAEIKARINSLTPSTPAKWGKMDVAQMLAHCNVTYEMAFGDGGHKKPGSFMRFILKKMVKNGVTNEKPYKQNTTTAPAFKMTAKKDFETEKQRLLTYLDKTHALGRTHFEGKESLSFDAMTATEWNNMFYKHLDHHLAQFGA